MYEAPLTALRALSMSRPQAGVTGTMTAPCELVAGTSVRLCTSAPL
jgi:hypothetical protein